MADKKLGQNISFPIYNADGTYFRGLVLRKATVDSVIMSLGDKITGDVYYKNNKLPVSMGEYIIYNGVKYTLVNPPTVIREGMVNGNSELKGMTKFSFEFYHPMYQLSNMPFSDVAVSGDEQRYLSENKKFSWIGKPDDYIGKLNKNLEGTEWVVVKSTQYPEDKENELSEVMQFDKATIADALKTWYDTWEIPFVIDVVGESEAFYTQEKRFKVVMGLPSEEILDAEGNPYVFKMGQGVGLKNNSRTPKNNKIVTRISPYGSERNIPYGYPQIVWKGNQDAKFTIGDSVGIKYDVTINGKHYDKAVSYPIYDGIVGGRNVRLIKHPFTRDRLMPSIYSETVDKKVNPYNSDYNCDSQIKDYYDADDSTYPNPINTLAPSYESHEFEDVYPRLGEMRIGGAEPFDTDKQTVSKSDYTLAKFNSDIDKRIKKAQVDYPSEVRYLTAMKTSVNGKKSARIQTTLFAKVTMSVEINGNRCIAKYDSDNINLSYTISYVTSNTSVWDDSMNDDAEYKQSYFKITLPRLDFDMYACASITEKMDIYMRSGACIGCTFSIQVDWDDYKRNFFDSAGNFKPDGEQRDLSKYPKTNDGIVTVIVHKDNETFGTLMPNVFQQPKAGDEFVFLGISLPTTYITNAEKELDDAARQYMLENNIYYFEYPLKFDEHFLATHTNILTQIKPNAAVHFKYEGEDKDMVRYVKQMTIKYGQGALPQYEIVLTDDIDVVLNKLGQVTDDVSRLRLEMSQLMQYYGGGIDAALQRQMLDKLSRTSDDTAHGFIRFMQGLQVGSRFVSGILGEGGVFRTNVDGKTYIEVDNLYVRMKTYFDTVEVRHYKHSNGNRIATNAGVRCTRVAWIAADGNQTEDESNIAKFRCYFRASDGEDTVRNNFVSAADGSQDLVFFDKTAVEDGVNHRRYWRAAVGSSSSLTSDGEGWVDLSYTDCESPTNDYPMAGDDIIQLGNRTDKDRQGAIIEYVSGNDSPSYQIYQGINSYNLNGRNYIGLGYSSSTGRAYLNVYGDAYIGAQDGSTYVKYEQKNQVTQAPKLTIKAEMSLESTYGGKSLEDYVKEHSSDWTQSQIEKIVTDTTSEQFKDVNTAIDTLKKQSDGAIETWFDNGIPTLSNNPAKEWSTTELRERHLGDLYYDNQSGIAYRFAKSGNTYAWNIISDSAVAKALADAKNAHDLADGKRRIFVRQPSDTDTYDIGDMWVNATYTSGGKTIYSNDILRATKAKVSGTAFNISDWTLASRYSDDIAVMNNFLEVVYPQDKQEVDNIREQLDGKIDIYYMSGVPTLSNAPASGWSSADYEKHNGDQYLDTSTNYAYVFLKRNTVWSWHPITDANAVTALSNAADASALARGKRRVFTTQPTESDTYDIGDLWVNASYGSTYTNDILRAVKTKPSGATFSISDWAKASNYTDDTGLENFVSNIYSPFATDIKTQVDGKAETWYQSTDPSETWDGSNVSHKGDIWHNTSSTKINGVESHRDAIWSGTAWVQADVPSSVYDTIDGKAEIFVERPTTYNVNDLWIIGEEIVDNDIPTGCKVGDIVISKAKQKNVFSRQDWVKRDHYTDDTGLENFVSNIYNPKIGDIETQLDGKIDTWFSTQDPSLTWVDSNANHEGDMWYNESAKELKRYTKDGNTYVWKVIEDKDAKEAVRQAGLAQTSADGKMTVFVAQPVPPYKIGDLWVQGENGDILKCVYTRASGSYEPSDWAKASKYTDDTALETFKADKYVKQLIGGSISTSIANAQSAATEAKTTADNAQSDATQANNRLSSWADDGKIAPTEKLALKNQYEDVQEEYSQIIRDADSYGVNINAFYAAYLKASSAFKYYTRETPETIDIIYDSSQTNSYSHIGAYYSARQQILNAISVAAKEYAEEQGNTYLYDATLNAIRSALGGKTIIDGGLMLTSLISLRQLKTGGNPDSASSYTTWAGISGMYNESARGNGIAAWFGGEMIDHEYTPASANYAKSLFRFDGSGYLSGGDFTWTNNAVVSFNKGNIGDFEITKTVGESVGYIGNSTLDQYGNSLRLMSDGRAFFANSATTGATPHTLHVYGGALLVGNGVDIYVNTITGSDGNPLQHFVLNGFAKVDYLPAVASAYDPNSTSVIGEVAYDKDGYLCLKNAARGFTGSKTGGGGANGTVTRVAMSVPTGFSISGSPITTSGTLALSFASGYSLPTTAKQSNWDTAYGWGNHASAGYLKSASLNGYATQTWVTSQGYLTTSSLSGYATTSQLANYLPLSGGRMSGNINMNGKEIVLGGNCGLWDGDNGNMVIDSQGDIIIESVDDLRIKSESKIILNSDYSIVQGNLYIGEGKHELLGIYFGLGSDVYIEEDDSSCLEISAPKSINFYTNSFTVNGHPIATENTHYVTRIYAGASGTASNSPISNPYVKITDDNTYRNQIQFKGDGGTTVQSDTNGIITIYSTWRPLGTGASDACAGNDSRLSNARPASDVYSWAKASTKPSYSWGEIANRPTNVSSFTNDSGYITSSALGSYLPLSGGTLSGQLNTKNIKVDISSHLIQGSIESGEIQIGYDSGFSRSLIKVASLQNGTTTITSNIVTSGYFVKSGSSDNYVLLGGGGHKAVSDFAAASALSDYLPISGGTISGFFYVYPAGSGSQRASSFYVTDNGAMYAVGNSDRVIMNSSGVTAYSFIKTGGTSSQFLKADGSVDSNTYLTSSALSGYALTSQIPTNNNQLANGAGYQTRTGSIGTLLLKDAALPMNDCIDRSPGFHGFQTTGKLADGTFNPNGGDGFILQWSWRTTGPGGQLYFDDNPTCIMMIRGYDANVNFYKWLRVYTDVYHPSADKLSTLHTLWGQTFNGTQNISGIMTFTRGQFALSTSYTDTWSDGSTTHPWHGYDARNFGNGIYSTTISDYYGMTLKTAKCNLSINENTVMIGETTAGSVYKLAVKGHVYFGASLIMGAGDIEIDEGYAIFFDGGSETTSISYSGGELQLYAEDSDDVTVYGKSLLVYAPVEANSFTQMSDMRTKDVSEYMSINIGNIADAPLFKFTWSDGMMGKETHVGTSAQYWQKILPEVVMKDKNGFLSMQYDVLALASAISIAREVVSHEERIRALEDENKRLRQEVDTLKEQPAQKKDSDK